MREAESGGLWKQNASRPCVGAESKFARSHASGLQAENHDIDVNVMVERKMGCLIRSSNTMTILPWLIAWQERVSVYAQERMLIRIGSVTPRMRQTFG